jgi:antitoxin PrlF
MMSTATLTSKGQITIPKDVREGLGVGTGDRVEFVDEGGGVYRMVAATRDVRTLKGVVARTGKPVSVEEMIGAVRRRGGRR